MIRIPEEYNTTEKQTRGYIGLMGLSLGKFLFNNKEVMAAYASFMADQFSESYLLIADLPKRHNIMALDQVDEEEAYRRIKIASSDMKRFLEKVVMPYSNIKINTWTDCTNEAYENNLLILQKAYMQDKRFRATCDEGVKEFLNLPQNKMKIQDSARTLDDVLTQVARNRLEESAMLLAFPARFDGQVCEIYPGTNKLQEQLQRGEFKFCRDLTIIPTRMFMAAYYEE
jgi:tRNA-dependent cyclodipeptide synthase